MKNNNIEVENQTKTKKSKLKIRKHPLVDKVTENKARKVVKAYLKRIKDKNA